MYLLYRVQCTRAWYDGHTFIEIFAGVKLWSGGPEASYNILEGMASKSRQ